MDYKEIGYANSDTTFKICHFDLQQILDNGQAFRWEKIDKYYTGFAHGRRLDITQTGDEVLLKDVSKADFESIWKVYFDLERDYGEIRLLFAEYGGIHLQEAMDYSPGLRMLNQDPWETLISFILSQNSNIPRIKNMIRALCAESEFPSAEKLATADLTHVKSGYRAEYIIDAARKVSSGEIDLKALEHLPTDEVRENLMKIRGVGPKVADCVLLFAFGRTEVCPMDVWMKKVMTRLYPRGFPDEIKPFAGIAQQYLFHYVRTAKISF